MERKCLECKVMFTPSSSNIKKGGGKFCSRRCYHKQAIAHKKGKESPFWKGKNAGYSSIHDWLKAQYGVANKCENPAGCIYPKKSKNGVIEKPKVFDWALKKGCRYSSRARENFIQLCRSCHKKYDFEEKTRKRTTKGIFTYL